MDESDFFSPPALTQSNADSVTSGDVATHAPHPHATDDPRSRRKSGDSEPLPWFATEDWTEHLPDAADPILQSYGQRSVTADLSERGHGLVREQRETSTTPEGSREAHTDGGPVMESLKDVEMYLAALIEHTEQTEATLDALTNDLTNRVALLERYKTSNVEIAVEVSRLTETVALMETRFAEINATNDHITSTEKMLGRIELLVAQVSAEFAKGVIGQTVLRHDAREPANELQVWARRGVAKRPAFGHWVIVRVTLGVLLLASVAIMWPAAGADRADPRSRVVQEPSAPSTTNLSSTPPVGSISEQPIPTSGENLPKPEARAVAPRPPEFVGTLVLHSDPDDAAVLIDGQLAGRTPLQLVRLRAGSHAVWVEREGYQRWTASILVPAEKRTPVNVKLELSK